MTVTSLLISFCSDSPHSEPGNIDEADNGTEPHTSDEGLYVIVVIFYLNTHIFAYLNKKLRTFGIYIVFG